MAKTKTVILKGKADVKGLENGLKSIKDNTQKAEGSIRKFGMAAKVAIVAGIALMAKGLKSATQAAIRQEDAIKRLNTVLKSTRGVSGLTSQELQNMASALQKVTTYGDEAIMEAQALILTFTKIGKDVFPAATETVLNMSKAMGQDLKQTVIQVGKALNDPILGVTALRRVGVQLSESQEKLVKKFVALNDIAGAQKVILGELETQFGGVARAAAETFGGKIDQLKNTFIDFLEEVGRGITQNKKFGDAIADVKKLFESKDFRDGAKAIAAAIADAAAAIIKFIGGIAKAIGLLKQLTRINAKLEDQGYTEAEQYNKRLKLLREFKKQVKGTTDQHEAFHRAIKRITQSQKPYSDRLKDINILMKAAKEGKFGEEIARDYEKFRQSILGLIKEAPKHKEAVEKKIIAPLKKVKETLLDLPKSTQDPFADMGRQAQAALGIVQEETKKANSLWGKFTGGLNLFSDTARTNTVQAIQYVADGANMLISVLEDLGVEFTKEADTALNDFNAGLNAIASYMQGDFVSAIMNAVQSGIEHIKSLWNAISSIFGGGDKASDVDRLSEAFQKMLDLGSGQGGRIWHHLLENIKQGGYEIAEVTKYINEQMQSAFEAYKKYLAGNFSKVTFGVFEDMLAYEKKVGKNKELVEGAKALNDMMAGLSNATILSQTQFDKFEIAVKDAFDKLKEQGFTNNEIMNILGGSISRLKYLQDEWGFSIDDSTGELIDMAQNAGVLKDLTAPMEDMVDILREIADLLKNVLPSAFGTMARAGEAAFEDMSKAAGPSVGAIGSAGSNLGLAGSGMSTGGGNTYNTNVDLGGVTHNGGNFNPSVVVDWLQNNKGNIRKSVIDVVKAGG